MPANLQEEDPGDPEVINTKETNINDRKRVAGLMRKELTAIKYAFILTGVSNFVDLSIVKLQDFIERPEVE